MGSEEDWLLSPPVCDIVTILKHRKESNDKAGPSRVCGRKSSSSDNALTQFTLDLL
jgi:hypothetical protein